LDRILFTNLIGAAAATVSVASFVPQITKMLKTRDVSGVSLRTYAFTVSSFTLWVVYGLRLVAWPIVISNGCALALSAAVLVLKWRYGDRARPERPGSASP
jgi:MtN3 and saliva related transmembrane protein